MKNSLLIAIFAVSMISSFGQSSIDGTFLDDRDTLNFHNDSVSFAIMSNGGLIFPINGSGKYKITENILIIKAGKNPDKPKKKKTLRELGDMTFLENETVIFKINEQTEDQLDLTLLGICDNKEFNGNKTIKKFKRRHKKLIYRKRVLKKNQASSP